jgi:glutaminyl-tRNA synthetase
LWIERDDFEENPPPKYFRLFPGNSVRLRYAYIITCTGFDKAPDGTITAVRCTYNPETKGGKTPDNSKVKGTIHWVSAAHAISFEARVYDYLFSTQRPMDVSPRADGSPGEFTDNLSSNSLEIINTAYGEPCLAQVTPEDRFQFERLGYFARDPDAGADNRPVFNKTIGLRDTWGKIKGKS